MMRVPPLASLTNIPALPTSSAGSSPPTTPLAIGMISPLSIGAQAFAPSPRSANCSSLRSSSKSSDNLSPKGSIQKRPKIFVCKYVNCTKAFSKKWNLQAHQRLHTGLKPFKCRLGCGEAHMWMSSLKSHERRKCPLLPEDQRPKRGAGSRKKRRQTNKIPKSTKELTKKRAMAFAPKELVSQEARCAASTCATGENKLHAYSTELSMPLSDCTSDGNRSVDLMKKKIAARRESDPQSAVIQRSCASAVQYSDECTSPSFEEKLPANQLQQFSYCHLLQQQPQFLQAQLAPQSMLGYNQGVAPQAFQTLASGIQQWIGPPTTPFQNQQVFNPTNLCLRPTAAVVSHIAAPNVVPKSSHKCTKPIRSHPDESYDVSKAMEALDNSLNLIDSVSAPTHGASLSVRNIANFPSQVHTQTAVPATASAAQVFVQQMPDASNNGAIIAAKVFEDKSGLPNAFDSTDFLVRDADIDKCLNEIDNDAVALDALEATGKDWENMSLVADV